MSNNTSNDFLDFKLPQKAYAAFDAQTLKHYIVERLNTNEKFTDQNFEGSNLAAVIDIIAYSYHVLLFYLNNTASEVNFDQASLYENMNRIVKLIGYKPSGRQTSSIPINAVASENLAVGNYTIRKYSYFLVDSIQYTFLKDVSFSKTATGPEDITSINNNVILYQGGVGEYPSYTAQGEKFEGLTVVVDNIVDEEDARFIAENTLSVNVLEVDDGLYHTYTEVESLYLSKPVDRVFEKRLNENGHYDIKFGNGVFGRKLVEGDTVAVDYLMSDNRRGIISKDAINGNKLFVYDSSRQRSIFNDTFLNRDQTTFITVDNSSQLTFNNPTNSTTLAEAETVDQIRQNAPRIFSSQKRLVTENDYEALLNKNLANVINSVKVVSNTEYINQYIQYFYNTGVDPTKVNRVLINQVNFADSCDFNNVNIFVVPKFVISEDESFPPYLSNSFKNLIVELTGDKKMISNEVVPRDPVYMAFGLGVTAGSNQSMDRQSILNNTNLYIVRDTTNKVNKDTLKTRVGSIIKDFFLPDNNNLGQNLNLSALAGSILSIDGIKRIYTKNENEDVSFNGISFLSFNPVYPENDIQLVNQDTTLPFFKFPYLYSPLTVSNRITVLDE
tara:strand:+ start:654 stop:2495 length:1842 start_codon:yes stop_codon:yes gene_type:complete